MLTYPKTRMDKRWDMMPETLREVLCSPAYGETVLQIAENHHLNEIKREVVTRLTAFVIYGFIHPEELDDKIMEEIDVDRTTAKEVAEEIDKKIFEEFRKEISKMYSPVSETATQVESIQKPSETGKSKIGNIEITEDEEKAPEKEKKQKIRRHGILTPEKSEEGKEKKKDEPFIIHQEEGGGIKKKGKEERKSFQLGDFFGKEKKKEGPSAKIQTPGKKKPSSAKASEGKKTVHYSEYRSTMGPEKGKGFISTPGTQEKGQGIGTSAIGGSITKSQAGEHAFKKNKPEKKKNNKGSGPSVEGNTIDLRNL